MAKFSLYVSLKVTISCYSQLKAPPTWYSVTRVSKKFFSLRNAKTGRIERFITVANRKTADNGATILAGNQKVL